jgi:hypothetical protein
MASKRQAHNIDTGSAAADGSWLAGVYKLNYYREAWLGYSVLAHGTTRFASKEEACAALGVSFDGDALSSTYPAVLAGARKLPHQELLNTRHKPGQLAAFIQHAPHLDGTGLMTFALSDGQRSIAEMTRALLPASSAAEARTRITAAVEGAAAAPEYGDDEIFMQDVFGIALREPRGQAARALQDLQHLPDDFRGYWSTYVASTRIGVIHAACWNPRRSARPSVPDLIRRAAGRPR